MERLAVTGGMGPESTHSYCRTIRRVQNPDPLFAESRNVAPSKASVNSDIGRRWRVA